MVSARVRWGDSLDDEDALPPRQEQVDSAGIKTVIEFRKDEAGRTIKTITKSRTVTEERRIFKSVLERRKLKRFGDAAREEDAEMFTMQSKEDIPFERTNLPKKTKDEEKLADINQTLQGGERNDKASMVTNLREMLYRRRMERELAAARGIAEPDAPPGDDDGPGPGTDGKFVPMHKRMGAAGESMGPRRDDTASIRISNLPEETSEDDLRHLCRNFGQVQRVHVAYDKVTGMPRGFAFVNFVTRTSAEKALEKLNGHLYGHLVLMADWARSRPMQ
ncbi:unnamed protein product [Pedinophyceae sp. YPF-701]|nr:unnamed protein product [Pedinophyceae sp. YPF-701]